MSVQIDSDAFFRRLNALYSAWTSGYSDSKSFWHGIDGFVALLGKASDDAVEEKTVALHMWLLGYEFSEFLISFHKDKTIYFLGGGKKLNLLEPLLASAESQGFKMVLQTKGTDEENTASFKASFGDEIAAGKKFAQFTKETHQGALADQYSAYLSTLSNAEFAPLNGAVSSVLAVKDSQEIEVMKTASALSSVLLNQLRMRVLDVLDKDSKVSHRDLGNQIINLVEKPTPEFVKRCKDRLGITVNDDFEVPFALVQSSNGGFNLKTSAQNNKENLNSTGGNIVLALALKYKEYAVSVARTLLINPKAAHKALYEAVYEARQRAIERISEGNTYEQVFEAVQDRTSSHPDVQISIGARVGHATGLIFFDSDHKFAAGATQVLQPGTTVILSITATQLDKSGAPTENVVWIADTVLVLEGNRSGQLLTECKVQPSEIIFSISDEDDEDEDVKVERDTSSGAAKRAPPSSGASGIASTIRARPKPQVQSLSKQIEQAQLRVREMRTKQLQERIKSGELTADGVQKKSIKKFDQLSAYNDPAQYPADLKPNRIYVDESRDVVLVPINGVFVPFNAANIKNSTVQQEDQNKFVIRINFIVPTTLTAAQKNSVEDNPLADISSIERPIYLKELLFKVADGKALNVLNRKINDLAKRVKQKQKQQQDEADIGENVALVLNKTRAKVVLRDLMVRPTLGAARKMLGNLEAHQNGFRFQASKMGESIDIPYSNIKHAIFQRATESDPIVLVHFNLKTPVLLGGKRKSDDVQFYIEAGQLSEDLAGNRRGGGEMAEVAEEERERRLKKKLNTDFEKFCQEATQLASAFDFSVRFEEPIREMDFSGVPSKSSVAISPTQSALVHLIESFFVVSMDEVEVCVLERVGGGLRNFDAIFVFKDLRRPVVRIDAIGIESMDILKKFLTDQEIPVYEGLRSYKWVNVLKTVLDDLEDFGERGGFDYVFGDHPDSSDEEQDSDDDSDSDYVPSDEEGSDDASAASSDSDSDYDSSDDDDDSDFVEEQEEGEDWDEMERKFAEDDEEISEEEEDTRKKSSSGGRKPGRR